MKSNQSRLKAKKNKLDLSVIILAGVLAVFFATVCFVNFSFAPTFYNSDSYADIQLAKEMWNSKSVFPDGWVFGNQFSVFSTIGLAALFYGLTNNVLVSFGIAASLMTVLLFLAYNYMLHGVVNLKMRLIGFIVFITSATFSGSISDPSGGWQYYFTQASFYSCYLITAFIAFGIYIKMYTNVKFGITDCFMLTLGCLMSFACGMHSIRQTVVMIVPLIAFEMIRLLAHVKHFKRFILSKPFVTAIVLTASNFGGFVTMKVYEVQNHTIYGNVFLAPFKTILVRLFSTLYYFFNFFGGNLKEGIIGLVAGAAILVLWITAVLFRYKKRKADIKFGEHIRNLTEGSCPKQNALLILCALMLISLLAVLFSGFFLDMNMRKCYFFILIPLISLAFIHTVMLYKKYMRYALIVLAVMLCCSVALNVAPDLKTAVYDEEDAVYYQTAEYLEENGFDTLVTKWNLGERVGIASKDDVYCAFWHVIDDELVTVDYLCNVNRLDFDNNKAAYAVWNHDGEDVFINFCNSNGIALTKLTEIQQGEDTVILYKTDKNIFSVKEARLWGNDK